MRKLIRCLTHAGYRRYKVRCPIGFKAATSSVGASTSVQIRHVRRRVLLLLMVDLFLICFGDIVVQSACTVSRSIRARELGINVLEANA